MVALSIFMLIMIPAHDFANSVWYVFPSAYFQEQSEAILYGQRKHFVYEDIAEIDMNANGNISHAQTIPFPHDKRKVILELGGGRLVEK